MLGLDMRLYIFLVFLIFSTTSSAQNSTLPMCEGKSSKWENCFGTYSSKKMEYIGEFNENGSFHGQGTINYKNGETYVGGFRGGKRDGFGTLTRTDGYKYTGEFSFGKPGGPYGIGGQGTAVFPNGDTYVGKFYKGKMVSPGIYTKADGSILAELPTGKYTQADGSPNDRFWTITKVIIVIVVLILVVIGMANENEEAKKKRKEKELVEFRKKVADEKREAKKKAAEEEKIKKLCSNDDQWIAFKQKDICIGMHVELVELIHGQRYDEKRNVTKKSTKITCKYHRSTNQRKNYIYKLVVTYEDNRVINFKEL